MTNSAYHDAGTALTRQEALHTVLIMGCGDVGSAVGHRLHSLHARVVLCDLPAPAHARRGMAYTNALFDGTSLLDGIPARRVDDLDELRACWERGEEIPVTALAEQRLIEAFDFDVVIEATMRRNRVPADIRALAALTIGLGPGFAPGVNCHVAIETQWGAAMGGVVRAGVTEPLGGGPKPLDGVGRERFVAAPQAGRWTSSAVIGQVVRAGDVIGTLGEIAVRAPLDGTLRGVTHDGVDVRTGQKIIEVDPRVPADVFGLGERPLAIARGVALALGLDQVTAAAVAR